MSALIEVIGADYLTGDEDCGTFVESYIDVKFLGIKLFRKVIQSTDKGKIEKYSQTKREPIGY